MLGKKHAQPTAHIICTGTQEEYFAQGPETLKLRANKSSEVDDGEGGMSDVEHPTRHKDGCAYGQIVLGFDIPTLGPTPMI